MLPQILYNDVKTAVNGQQLNSHKMGIFNDIISIDIDYTSNPSYEESIFLRLNDFDSYYNQVTKGLGSGTYGKVFQVGNDLALKLLSSESATENQSYLLNPSFLREISILLR